MTSDSKKCKLEAWKTRLARLMIFAGAAFFLCLLWLSWRRPVPNARAAAPVVDYSRDPEALAWRPESALIVGKTAIEGGLPVPLEAKIVFPPPLERAGAGYQGWFELGTPPAELAKWARAGMLRLGWQPDDALAKGLGKSGGPTCLAFRKNGARAAFYIYPPEGARDCTKLHALAYAAAWPAGKAREQTKEKPE